MSSAEKPAPEVAPQETMALLQRILVRVDKSPRRHWLQITGAVVLSLTTIASAWCAYQAKLWGGVQAIRLATAARAGQKSTAAHLEAIQLRAFDASMFISYMQAKHEGNQRQEKFLFERFRPETKKAVEAWLRTDPFNNPAAPRGPFKMAEYVQPELIEAALQEQQAADSVAAARHALQTSDEYVLLTVLFASVLFFGGLSATLEWLRLRILVVLFALALFGVTLGFLTAMPICQE